MVLIIDLEATCWPQKTPIEQKEIIEFGCLLVNTAHKICGQYTSVVCPRQNPLLSDFCCKLTGISQSEIDRAGFWPQVLNEFQKYIVQQTGQNLLNLPFYSWGDYDHLQLKASCQAHHLEYPFGPHYNLKKELAQKQQGPELPLQKALQSLHLNFSGRPHRALVDCQNIYKIFWHLYS